MTWYDCLHLVSRHALKFTLILCSFFLYCCDEQTNNVASVRVVHHIQDVANIEILLDDQLILEATPNEMSRSVQVPQSLSKNTEMIVRHSGTIKALLRQKMAAIHSRENILILQGNREDIELVQVSQDISLSRDQHMLEIVVINLSSYELPNFSLIHEDANDPISSDEIIQSDVFLTTVPAANNVLLRIEVNDQQDQVQYDTSTEVYEDLLENESSLLLITFEQSRDTEARFTLSWIPTSN